MKSYQYLGRFGLRHMVLLKARGKPILHYLTDEELRTLSAKGSIAKA